MKKGPTIELRALCGDCRHLERAAVYGQPDLCCAPETLRAYGVAKMPVNANHTPPSCPYRAAAVTAAAAAVAAAVAAAAAAPVKASF